MGYAGSRLEELRRVFDSGKLKRSITGFFGNIYTLD